MPLNLTATRDRDTTTVPLFSKNQHHYIAVILQSSKHSLVAYICNSENEWFLC